VVLCVDEEIQIQALDHRPDTCRCGFVSREGDARLQAQRPTVLLPALEFCTGKVTEAWYDRHGKVEFHLPRNRE
jgi:hypothetical protein